MGKNFAMCHNLPALIGHAVEAGKPRDRRPIHEPDGILAVRTVPPGYIGSTVIVEIIHTHNLPALIGHAIKGYGSISSRPSSVGSKTAKRAQNRSHLPSARFKIL